MGGTHNGVAISVDLNKAWQKGAKYNLRAHCRSCHRGNGDSHHFANFSRCCTRAIR